MEAVNMSWEAIKCIENPGDKVQKSAVSRSWEAIGYIENPSDEVQKTAIRQTWKAIKYIKSPCRDVQLKAVSQKWEAILYIKNIDKDVREYIAQNDAVAGMYAEYDFANDCKLEKILQLTDAIHTATEPLYERKDLLSGANKEQKQYYGI
jgi:hypothetical protein